MFVSMNSVTFSVLALITLNLVVGQQFYNVGNDVRCARLWDDVNYNGDRMDCEQNERRTNLGNFDCKAESVIVRNGCTLTAFNKAGCRKLVIDRSSSCLPSNWKNQIHTTCCECDGCYGEMPRRDLSCARLYQHHKCSSCSGYRLDVNPMDEITHLNILNNQISSLNVKSGCQITVWEGFNYTGSSRVFTGPTDWLDRVWNDRISSLKCEC